MKNKIVAIVFLLLILGLPLLHVLTPDKPFSDSERRELEEFPPITIESLAKGEWLTNFESYLLDQFPARDATVAAKSLIQLDLLGQLDNNGFYLYNNGIYKSNYPIRESSIENFAAKINSVYSQYLSGSNAVCAIVPDRGQYVASEHGYLSFDYAKMREILNSSLSEINYIDLLDKLTVDNFYNTDLHWKQETLLPLAEYLAAELGVTLPQTDYTTHEYTEFLGGYYSRAPYYLNPETLTYLTSVYTETAYVEDYQHPDFHSVYNTERLEGVDSYDVYLSGATPLITITNPEAESERELIIFRDSYGSSLAPLLLPGYSSITLIDLRYISSDLLGEMVDFHGQDVLFMFGIEVINSSAMLK